MKKQILSLIAGLSLLILCATSVLAESSDLLRVDDNFLTEVFLDTPADADVTVNTVEITESLLTPMLIASRLSFDSAAYNGKPYTAYQNLLRFRPDRVPWQ